MPGVIALLDRERTNHTGEERPASASGRAAWFLRIARSGLIVLCVGALSIEPGARANNKEAQ
jgi:hypothetical protein